MSYDAPYPEFSWSHSRDRALAECARAYFWRYYGSHGGWLPDAPQQTRQAYALKQLTTFPLIVGSAVHECARDCALATRNGAVRPSFEVMLARVSDALNRAVLGAHHRAAFVRDPKRFVMLRDTWHSGRPDSSALPAAVAKARLCLRTLEASAVWQDLEGCHPEWPPSPPPIRRAGAGCRPPRDRDRAPGRPRGRSRRGSRALRSREGSGEMDRLDGRGRGGWRVNVTRFAAGAETLGRSVAGRSQAASTAGEASRRPSAVLRSATRSIAPLETFQGRSSFFRSAGLIIYSMPPGSPPRIHRVEPLFANAIPGLLDRVPPEPSHRSAGSRRGLPLHPSPQSGDRR